MAKKSSSSSWDAANAAKLEAYNKIPAGPKAREEKLWFRALRCWQLYLLLIPALVWLVLFAYYPMYGLLIAFKDFKIRAGIVASPWADPIMKYFTQFFATSAGWEYVWNTVILSGEQLIMSFWVPVVFALLLNQIRNKGARKAVQTISYAPYFLSNVVLVCIIQVMFGAKGVVNNVVTSLGGTAQGFITDEGWFRPMYIGSTIWQSMGFNAIIYIAALTGIDPTLYEAAVIDGANRFQRVMKIDLPLILPTIILMFVMAIGNIMTVGYEKAYLMQASTNLTVSELISTHVYKAGLQSAQYSYATAVGLFNSVVNFIILFIANFASTKLADISIF